MSSEEHVNDSYFSQYVNFDQFLMQHNIGNSAMPFNQRSSGGVGNGHHAHSRTGTMPNDSNHNNGNNNNTQWHNGIGTGFDQYRESPRVASSNLVATAAEFVPRGNRCSSSANAEAFTPRGQHASAGEGNRNSETNKGRWRREANATTAAATETLTNALSNARISDGAGVELRSSGGAIKKVRDQNQRNDSGDRHEGE